MTERSGWSACDERTVDPFDRRHTATCVKALRDTPLPGTPERLSIRLVVQQLHDRPSQRLGVAGGHQESGFSRSHDVARSAGQDVVLLYPGVVYGPGELTDGNIVVKMVADHLRGRFPGFVGPGDRLWSYAFVEDVAEGHALALERGRSGERYFLCGDNVTLVDLFATLGRVAGVPPPTRHIPYGVASLLGRTLWAWAELTGHPPELTHEVVDVFREHWAYSSAKAERELGYRSRPLLEGLKQTVAWLREQKAI